MFELNKLYNVDCMVAMAEIPDNYFDLAIVDVPYGIGESNKAYLRGGKQPGNALAVTTEYAQKQWDKQPPPAEYFTELMRVSKNQIIWGANHFISRIPFDSSCWIVWDKDNGSNDFADCELAWTSFNTAVRRYKYRWHGMLQENMREKEVRIHPTQKPVALYAWLLDKYAKPGDIILDTHVGSASSLIACYRGGFRFVGFEIDPEYCAAATERLSAEMAQIRLDLRGGGWYKLRLSKKHEEGIRTACEILSDVAEMAYECENERLTFAHNVLHEILESSRKQKAKDRQKRAFERWRKERAKECENSCL